MKRIIFLLPFLSLGCASTPPPLPAGATELEGTWQLESVRCEQGENGPMTKAIAKALANGTQEELYVVNGSKMEWHVRERKEGGDRDSYCETVYADTWKLKDGHILGTGPVFRSRVGYLAYRCY
ncbi:MAG: hypothetical protein ACXVCG_22685, partial [Bdellovibrionota bacterium]